MQGASANQAPHGSVAEGTVVGFLTDPTRCIGCKACEVACKEWNQLPAEPASFSGSYDHTGALGASSWRHVKFVEQPVALGRQVTGVEPLRWIFLSDVCKHCERAGCLEACPTGALVRTEVGSVLVQDDVCNGCGYCVVTCPFGVIDRRPEPLPGAGGAYKCTLCYDRQRDGLTPACAKSCPTESIQFGPLEELRARAAARLLALRERGICDAALYDAAGSSVGGLHALAFVIGEPESFGLPRSPVLPQSRLPAAWASAALTCAAALALCALAFAILPA
jgi:formate dehydrogenase iron-sulfur subunit